MKITLIVLVCIAVILGIVAYFSVFSGAQVIEPVAGSQSSSSAPTMVLTAPSSSASTTAVGSESSSISTTPGTYSSVFSAPYPVSWPDSGSSTLSIEAAQLVGDQLTLDIKVVTGNTYVCVPMNLRIVTDEQGDMQAPDTSQFQFADSGGCQATPDVTYNNQAVVFTIAPTTASPFLLTTGGTSNIFFEISTTTTGGLQVAIPQQSG